MTDCCDAKLLQRLVRQARQDRLIYLVLAERCLVLSEAKAPQPDHDVHDGAHNGWRTSPAGAMKLSRIPRASTCVKESPRSISHPAPAADQRRIMRVRGAPDRDRVMGSSSVVNFQEFGNAFCLSGHLHDAGL